MKTFIVICISAFCGLITLSSCSTTSVISFEHLTAADLNFPESIRKVAVVNNVANTIADSIANAQSTERRTNRNIYTVVQTVSGDDVTTAEELAYSLADQDYFDMVIINDSVLREADTIPRLNRLTQPEVQMLSEDLGVDMLISLEKNPLKITRHFIEIERMVWVQTEVKVTPTVSFYVPSRTQPIYILQKSDSIYWENSLNDFELGFISDEQILLESSAYAGKLAASSTTPTWIAATRFLFSSGSTEMKDGAFFVKNQQWDSALPLWEKAYEGNTGNKKARAASNIALYYEMTSELEKADEWMQKAISVLQAQSKTDIEHIDIPEEPYNDLTKVLYNRAALKKRIADLPKLKPQMQRFDDDFPTN